MSTISLGSGGIIGISYRETSLLKSSLLKAGEKSSNAASKVNAAKMKLQIDRGSNRIRVESQNLQSYYNRLKKNSTSVEKIIKDVDYIVRRFKEVDSRCANRVKSIGMGYKRQASISKIGNSLMSMGNNVVGGVTTFFQNGISAITSMSNSSINWVNNHSFVDNTTLGNSNLVVYPGVAMAGGGLGASTLGMNGLLRSTTIGPAYPGGAANRNGNSSDFEKYIKKSWNQIALGAYTEDVTALGIVGEIGLSLTPVGLGQDLRDFSQRFTKWEWSWEYFGGTLLSTVILIPGVSEFKKLGKAAGAANDAAKAFKNIDKVDDTLLKNIDKIDDTLKGVNKTDYSSISAYKGIDVENIPVEYRADPHLTTQMNFKGKGKGSTNAAGWERNAGKHFNELLENNPEYLSEVNTTRIEDGLVPIVDEQFANYFPQYRDRIGDKLIHHHIGGGGQAAAVPETLHKGFGGIHNIEKENGIRGNDILTNIAETLSKDYKK